MTLTVASVNVNGIRAAVKERHERNRGMLTWLRGAGSEIDVLALQEVRATTEQASAALAPLLDGGWHLAVAPAEAKGRAGVALLSRTAPRAVQIGFDDGEFAASGRYIEASFAGPGDGEELRVGSLYLPSGSAGTPKQDEKERFMAQFRSYLAAAVATGAPYLICGDWNIAHQEADLKNHANNHKTSGFLPQERAWMSDVFAAESGLVDVVRARHPGEAGPYSWWSQRGKAFDNDAGWRIDYHVATAGLARRATADYVARAAAYDERWSDHAPVVVTYS